MLSLDPYCKAFDPVVVFTLELDFLLELYDCR